MEEKKRNEFSSCINLFVSLIYNMRVLCMNKNVSMDCNRFFLLLYIYIYFYTHVYEIAYGQMRAALKYVSPSCQAKHYDSLSEK